MIGYDVKCKFPYDDIEKLEKAYDCIQLTEPHEAGEIINNNWLIVNCYFDEFKGSYKTGDYVKIIDIRYFDIIASDKNFDDRKDLIKLGVEKKRYTLKGNLHEIYVNIYKNIDCTI
jgi:hypothetical protein